MGRKDIGAHCLEIGFGIFLFALGEAIRYKTEMDFVGGTIETIGAASSLYNGKLLGKQLELYLDKVLRR